MMSIQEKVRAMAGNEMRKWMGSLLATVWETLMKVRLFHVLIA